MLDLLEEAGLPQVVVVEQLGKRGGPAAGDVGGAQDLQPFGGGAMLHALGEQPVGRVHVRRARLDAAEAGVLDQLGPAHRLEDAGPLHVAHRDHTDKTVLRRIGPAMRGHHARIPHAFLRLAQAGVLHVLDQDEVEHRLHHRHMDLLALAGALAVEQRHADHRGQHMTAHLVGDHGREIARRAVRAGVERGDAADALDQIVEGRALLHRAAFAEAAGAGEDDARIARGEAGVVEAEPLGRVEAHVVDHDVGRLDQPPERLSRRILLQIQHDAALVAVQRDEVGAHPLGPARADLPAIVAVAGFHLDDFGTHVAEDLCREWAEHHGGEVDHPDARERAAIGLGHRRPPVRRRSTAAPGCRGRGRCSNRRTG